MHPGQREFLKQLRAEIALELYEERAAIMEYDGGLPRADAERLALLAHPPPHCRGPHEKAGRRSREQRPA